MLPYAVWLVAAYRYHFLDGVNLAFHEAGHLFLAFAGEALHVLGGTFGQLVFPAALALQFRARGDAFASAVCALWLGESLMYAAVYLGDARDQVLPLVGGHRHDWFWLLAKADLLRHCRSLERLLHLAASAVVVLAWLRAARAAFAPADSRGLAPA
jgi:hypothetical protein